MGRKQIMCNPDYRDLLLTLHSKKHRVIPIRYIYVALFHMFKQLATNYTESNFYIESIESLVTNKFYDLIQLDIFHTLYQVEKDTQFNVCFFECTQFEVQWAYSALQCALQTHYKTIQCAYSAGCAYPFYPLQMAVPTVPTLWRLQAGTTAASSGHCIYTVLTLSFWVIHCSPTVGLQCTAAVGLQWV